MNRKIIVLTAVMLFVSGCGGKMKIRAYEGAERPLAEVALVKLRPDVSVRAVDGNKDYKLYAEISAPWAEYEISLLPGKHTFEVCFFSSYRFSTVTKIKSCKIPQPLSYYVKAGGSYRIDFDIEENEEEKIETWSAYIVDLTEFEEAKRKQTYPKIVDVRYRTDGKVVERRLDVQSKLGETTDSFFLRVTPNRMTINGKSKIAGVTVVGTGTIDKMVVALDKRSGDVYVVDFTIKASNVGIAIFGRTYHNGSVRVVSGGREITFKEALDKGNQVE